MGREILAIARNRGESQLQAAEALCFADVVRKTLTLFGHRSNPALLQGHCPICGAAGQSLVVDGLTVCDTFPGSWFCYACSRGGDYSDWLTLLADFPTLVKPYARRPKADDERRLVLDARKHAIVTVDYSIRRTDSKG